MLSRPAASCGVRAGDVFGRSLLSARPARSFRLNAENAQRTYRTIFGTQEAHQVSIPELLGSDGGEPRFMSPYFESLSSAAERTALPILIYIPGLDGVGYAAYSQLETLTKGFQLESFMIPFSDKHDFQRLLDIFTKYLRDVVGPESHQRMVYLLGESFGALLALAAAFECKDVVDRLILVNPATGYNSSVISNLAPLLPTVPKEMYRLLSGFMAPLLMNPFDVLAQGLNGTQPSPAEIPYRLMERGLEMLGTLDLVSDHVTGEMIQWKLEVLQQGLDHVEPYLHKVPQRTLVLASENDLLLQSASEAQRLKRDMLRAFVKILPGKSHAIMEDASVDLLQLLKDEGFCVSERKMTSVNGNGTRPPLNGFGSALPIELPSKVELEKLEELVGTSKRLSSPVFLSTLSDGRVVQGLDGVPEDRPLLFVGNHTLMALDMNMLVHGLMAEKDILLRGLAHPAVMRESANVVKVPDDVQIGPLEMALLSLFNPRDAYKLYTTYGAVPVNPMNMHRLLSLGECVLLYPGGAIEALKLRGEKYQIQWPDRSEFVRMAAKFGATVVTVASVGSEDGVYQLLDGREMMEIPALRDSMMKFSQDAPQARRGVAAREDKMKDAILSPPIMLPLKPARQYFLFGKPVQLTPEIANDADLSGELYQQFKVELETGISYLLENREEDPYKEFETRLLYETLNRKQAPTFVPVPFPNGHQRWNCL